eukprot:2221843-Prorocentrum_lima.AAC.1
MAPPPLEGPDPGVAAAGVDACVLSPDGVFAGSIAAMLAASVPPADTAQPKALRWLGHGVRRPLVCALPPRRRF